MASPISGSNPAPVANNKSPRSDVRGNQAQGDNSTQAEHVAASQNETAVNVSRAAEVLNSAPAERGEGAIQSSEHAAEAAQLIKTLFESNPGQALAGQAGGVSSSIMDLLKTG